jgi:DNA-3-methyladenine glycosylase I
MAGAPRVRSLNIAAPEADARPVLVPGGNKAPAAARKPSPKPLRKAAAEKPPVVAAAKEEAVEGLKKDAPAANVGARKGLSPLTAAAAGADGGARKGSPPLTAAAAGASKGSSPLPSPRRTPPRKLHDVPALNASLSASCSSDASVESLRRGRASGGRTERSWSRPAAPKRGKAAAKEADDAEVIAPVTTEAVQGKRRCAWVTPTSGELLLPDHFLFYLITS